MSNDTTGASASLNLEALRSALAAGPTPGPWKHDLETYGSESDITIWAENEDYVVNIGYAGNQVDADGQCIAFDASKANAAYIAACDPTTIGALVAELTARRARDAEVEALVTKWQGLCTFTSDGTEYLDDVSVAVGQCIDELTDLLPFQRNGDKTP